MAEENKIKILIIDDEASIRKFISINLRRNNFDAFEASCGEEALDVIKNIFPRVIILDIMLPGINGFDLCSKIRDIYPEILIIMLTAKGQDMDKIMGIDLGADDYMVKPFNPLELVARIRALLRRSISDTEKQRSHIISSGRLTVNLNSKKLFRDNKEIEVTPREFSLINVFVNNPNKALSRDELLNLAWGQDFFGDYKTVDVHVRRLREKIEDDPSKPIFIQTLWGYGYLYQEVK